jgi:hypothetical protein
VFWVSAFLPRHLLLSEFGILNGVQLGLSLGWTLAEVVLATLLGAAVYKEQTAPAGAGAREVLR